MKRVEPQVTSQTGGKNNSKVFSSVPDAIRLGLFLAFSALLIICERTRRLSNYAATQQKELQLSQLEQRYFDLVRVMIVALAPDETVIKINKKGCEILGYRPEEIIGKNWFDTCVPEESRNEIRKVFQDLLGTEPQNAESYQNPVITKTGEERIIEWRNTTFYNPDTKKIIVLCAGEDITEYIKTNAALRESEAKFRSLADDALVGIFMVQDWHYIFANKYLAEILGYSVEELLNLENWIDVVAPDERPIATMTVEGMLSDKQSQRREIRLQRKDGKLIDVDGISALTEYDGKPALIGTVVDITEKKALERQKEDFFAMATHDLKSPLTVIMSCSEMLVKKCQQFDENTKRFIDLIHGSSRKLFHLVEDFLSVTQMEAGRLTPKIAPSDIHLILREAQAELEKEAQEKGIHFYMEIPNLPQQISLDPNLVQRAVFNLLQNSVNYTQPGGSIILKAEWNASEDRDFLLISVKDTGKGISPEEQESIFEKYYRSPRTAGIKGTGLGLTIVKAVAEAHGGFVTVKSEVNKGSTFTLCFPLALKMKQRA